MVDLQSFWTHLPLKCRHAQVEYAIYFVGSFLDQLVRGRDCDLEGFCLSVRVIVDGNPAGDYRIAKTAGVTVNGFVSARLRPGVHQVLLLFSLQRMWNPECDRPCTLDLKILSLNPEPLPLPPNLYQMSSI